MKVNPYDVQNWRISREIAKILAQSKNLALLHWRIKNNLSQEQAAERCGVYNYVWAGLENHRLIPTTDEAEKIATTVDLPKWFLFPQLRVKLPKNFFVRTTSKLTFIRAVRGLSMKTLSQMAGVPYHFVSELERGYEADTNFMDYVLKIAEALNSQEGYLKVNPEDIVGDIPDDFFINHESLEEALKEELE